MSAGLRGLAVSALQGVRSHPGKALPSAQYLVLEPRNRPREGPVRSNGLDMLPAPAARSKFRAPSPTRPAARAANGIPLTH